MLSPIRKSLDILLTMGGLGMGAVLSILSAICLFLIQLIHLDPGTLALAWVMLALIFSIGFISARKQMNTVMDEMELVPE